MILDLDRFIRQGETRWAELDELVRSLESGSRLSLEQIRALHSLYERTASDLVELAASSSVPEVRLRLESLVARAYAEIHETRDQRRLFLWKTVSNWLWHRFPRTFRRHLTAFWVATWVTGIGATLGGVLTAVDPDARHVTMAFGHNEVRPSERVRLEESTTEKLGTSRMTAFSTQLMVNNTRVSLLCLALGMSWGVGTLILLFYNGIILGAVGWDYILDGEAVFLLAWILPHGSVEIPAILISGQCGFMIGHALLGRGSPQPLADRIRAITGDLVTLILGVALLLVYAGVIEAFLSQWHEPAIPYWLKIVFGSFQLIGLILYLGCAGSKPLPNDIQVSQPFRVLKEVPFPNSPVPIPLARLSSTDHPTQHTGAPK